MIFDPPCVVAQKNHPIKWPCATILFLLKPDCKKVCVHEQLADSYCASPLLMILHVGILFRYYDAILNNLITHIKLLLRFSLTKNTIEGLV
jgi:hypothetical protein